MQRTTHLNAPRPVTRYAGLPWRELVWRGVWLLLLLGHTPPSVGALLDWVRGGQSVDLGRAIVLLSSQALFVLKLLDARFLRLPTRPQDRLRLAVLVGLIHARVFSGAIDVELAVSDVPAIGWSVVLQIAVLDRMIRRQKPAAPSAAGDAPVPQVTFATLAGWLRNALPPRLVLIPLSPQTSHRAPPHSR